MKKFVLGMVLAGSLLLGAPGAWADGQPKADAPGAGAGAIEMSHYVVALVYPGPEWRSSEVEGVKELEAAHLQNIFRLRSTGEMLVSGPFANPGEGEPVGLFVFAVATVAEAEALLATDPAIRAGHFRADLLPWMTPSPLGPPAAAGSHAAAR